jgi:hypothetical protein
MFFSSPKLSVFLSMEFDVFSLYSKPWDHPFMETKMAQSGYYGAVSGFPKTLKREWHVEVAGP